MKAKIIDKKELKKSPIVRQAEALLKRLNIETAIEVELTGTSSRTIRRAFSKAATNLGLSIQLRTRNEKVYVVLKNK